MRRRQFIALLGGAVSAWPGVARAQQDGRVRVMGWLDAYNSKAITTALREGLAKLGWIEGRNLKIVRRFSAGDANRLQASAAELVSLAPDVILAGGAAPARILRRATQTIPIVFSGGGDAIANGLVKNIVRPEGNVTGFSSSEPTIGGKWLELLKEAAPRVERIAIVYKPEIAPTALKYIAAIEPAGRTLSVRTVKVPFSNVVELVHAIDAFAAEPNGGLLMLPPPSADRSTTLKLAAQHRLPALYQGPSLNAEGGLISYNSDLADLHHHAASYVDRILRGANVADLPVQFPVKYKLVVNIKTAKAIGLTIPASFLVHADEVIE